ncbi:MAG: tetraacyldisaccharide 4'-kinase [Gammaproteobacteria bacterium]|nr:tetraacyldisaccharide 4'-kinase [Gammaproteobacteria bacterium]
MIKALKRKLEFKLFAIWQSKQGAAKILRPISWLYCAIVICRRLAYHLKLKKTEKVNVPVIMVGNLTVGGTGKTPLVTWLTNYLKDKGYQPGIISRGYGGKARHWPQQVRPDGDPYAVGDEAILISKRTHSPMAVGPERLISCQELLQYHPSCNVIISDDGLQHYALHRDIEVAVVDGKMRFGNGYCLPAGALREPVKRLEKVDFIIANGEAQKDEYAMRYTLTHACSLLDSTKTVPLEQFKRKEVHAVAGIGNPDRFFTQLQEFGIKVIPHPFPDHHPFTEEELVFEDKKPILMTEKDAVKCKRYAQQDFWYVPVTVEVQEIFGQKIIEKLKEIHTNG